MGHYEYDLVKRYVPDRYNNASCGCGCGGCGCVFWVIVLVIALQIGGCLVIKPIAPHWPFVQGVPENSIKDIRSE